MSVKNKVVLIGNLARDPEPGKGSGNVARFSVAVDSYNSTTKTREAEFFRVTAFSKSAEFVMKFFTKGSGIVVEGHLKNNKWNDPRTGEEKREVQIIADSIDFPPKGGGGAYGAAHTPAPGATLFDDDDETSPDDLFA